MRVAYPVIFTQTEDGFLVQVPDLEIFTEGTDINNAIYMARDAISITLVSKEENGEPVPEASASGNIDVSTGEFAKYGKSFISMVDVNIKEFE